MAVALRAVLEERVEVFGHAKYWCGKLPTADALHLTFPQHRHYQEGEEYFPGPVHRLAAALAAAHFRHAGQGLSLDEVMAVWASAEEGIAELQRELDYAVTALAPEPSPAAVEYHESYGALVSRLAYLWVRSTLPPAGVGIPLNGYYRDFLQEMSPVGRYTLFLSRLDQGMVRLPPLPGIA